MRPPSEIETFESPPGKGIVEERFKRGTTEDIFEADVQSDGASGIQNGAEFKKLENDGRHSCGGENDANPKAIALIDG